MHRRNPKLIPTPEELQLDRLKITQLFAEECPKPKSKPFALFAVDCSSNPRVYSEKLEDRSYVHQPTKVPGQKPITVGHQYSTLVYLPEKSSSMDPHWVIPLSTVRVQSNRSGTLVGMEQITQIMTETQFKDGQLCVLVDDSAYSHAECIQKTLSLKNLVNVSRMRNNRIFYLEPTGVKGSRKRGRPKIYGERWALVIHRDDLIKK